MADIVPASQSTSSILKRSKFHARDLVNSPAEMVFNFIALSRINSYHKASTKKPPTPTSPHGPNIARA